MNNDNDRRKAARDLINAVRDVFSRWDASGVLSRTEGRDAERLDEECVAKIAALLLKNASLSEVTAFLDRTVSKSVGVTSDPGRNKEFAEQFIAVGKGHRVK